MITTSEGSGRKLQIQVFKWSFNQENVEQTGHKYRVIDAQDSSEQTFFLHGRYSLCA